jgi:hypothetical protein
MTHISIGRRKIFRFSALKYELACNIKAPHNIIWCNGAYKGQIADITIARDKLIRNLEN